VKTERKTTYFRCRNTGASPIDMEREKILNRERNDDDGGFALHKHPQATLSLSL